MATIKFRIRKTAKPTNSIYITLSLGRGNYIEKKTGFEIESGSWSESSSYPKKNNATNKNLHADLKSLESFIYESINIAQSKGEIIDKFWLENKIMECFNRVEKNDNEIVINYYQYFIDNSKYRKVKGRKELGISESRINSYKTSLSIFKNFESYYRKKITFSELNKQFEEQFVKWLLENQSFSTSYAGKQIDNLKAVCIDAQKTGLNVNNYAFEISTFSTPEDERFIKTFSLEELNTLLITKMKSESLENVKKWILIGCEIGQRGDDLLKISFKKWRKIDDYIVIDVYQSKGKKWITAPIIKPEIIKIFKEEPPYPISIQKFNDYIKKVCLEIKMTNIEVGKKVITDGENRRRSVLGEYPKWELMTSHSLRRTFATNYYKKIKTPVLMGITAHVREADFLKYINKHKDKDDNAKLFALEYKSVFM